MRNMYKYNSRKEDVVGSIDSINSISKEILYKCYNTFYHPKNMFLCISGDVDVDKTFELIENNQSKKEFMPFWEKTASLISDGDYYPLTVCRKSTKDFYKT